MFTLLCCQLGLRVLYASLGAPSPLEERQEGPLSQARRRVERSRPIHHLWGELLHGTVVSVHRAGRVKQAHNKQFIHSLLAENPPSHLGWSSFAAGGEERLRAWQRHQGVWASLPRAGRKAFRYQTLGVIISVSVRRAHVRVRVRVVLARIPEAECVRRG